MSDSDDTIVRLCEACDGQGYLHDGVSITMLDLPHKVRLPGIEPCDDCERCPDCGRDGCGPGVRWDEDALVDVISARELADACAERDARGEILDEAREKMGLDEHRPWTDIGKVGAAALRAVAHIVNRAQHDPDLYYQIGYGTETFHLLTLAESLACDEPHEDVRRRRSKTHGGDRRSTIVELREQIRALESGATR